MAENERSKKKRGSELLELGGNRLSLRKFLHLNPMAMGQHGSLSRQEKGGAVRTKHSILRTTHGTYAPFSFSSGFHLFTCKAPRIRALLSVSRRESCLEETGRCPYLDLPLTVTPVARTCHFYCTDPAFYTMKGPHAPSCNEAQSQLH